MAQLPRSIFFDASVLFAGCRSPEGASGLLIEASIAGVFQPAASQLVIAEARAALKLKSGTEALLRFYELLTCPALKIAGVPAPEEIEPYLELIADKDCHVLASAAASGVQFLLTLDRKHFFTPPLRQADLPFTILTPGDFLKHCREANQTP